MTRKELLYGMSKNTNLRFGPNDLEGRYHWYQERLDKLVHMTETHRVKLAKLCTLDRLDLIIELLKLRKEKDAA